MSCYDNSAGFDTERAELAQQILERCEPLTEDTAPWRYLVHTRGLPAGAIRYIGADLRVVPPGSVPGFPAIAYGIVSLLRDAAGGLTGLEAEACGPAGEKVPDASGRTLRRSFALQQHGCRDGAFRVEPAGPAAVLCYAAEGRLAKPAAIAAAVEGAAILGVGSRKFFGHRLPPEMNVVVVADKRPPEGTAESVAHDGDVEHGCDRYLAAGKLVSLVTTSCDCGRCTDPDDVLKVHGPEALAALLRTAMPVEMSLDGLARKCAAIKDPLRRAAAVAQVIKDRELRQGGAGMAKAFRMQVGHYLGAAISDDGEDAADNAAGQPITFEPVVAATDPQDGLLLFNDIAAAVRRHAHAEEHEITMAVVWTVHNHRRFHGNIGTLQRLIISAGREDSGKSHLGECLAHLGENAEVTTTPTAPNIYRATQSEMFVLDEVNEWYHRDTGMQAVINAGFHRSATISRIEDVSRGDRRRELERRRYSVFFPLCLIGINLEKVLARTVLSRSLIIRMRPARASDVVEDLYDNEPAVHRLRVLAGRIKRWVADNEMALAVSQPRPPAGVFNRRWLVWKPYLALAEQVGGDWPARVAEACAAVHGRGADQGLGMRMLGDVLRLLQASPDGRMYTSDLIAKLLIMEMREWATYGRARMPVRDVDLAHLLEPYELKSTRFYVGKVRRRGYTLEDALKAVERYAPQMLRPDWDDEAGGAAAGGADGAADNECDQEGGDQPVPPSHNGEMAANPPCSDGTGTTDGHIPQDRPVPSESGGFAGVGPEWDGGTGKNGPPNATPINGGTCALACARCGAPFLPPGGPGARPKYCGPDCRTEARKARARVKGATEDNDPKVEFLP